MYTIQGSILEYKVCMAVAVYQCMQPSMLVAVRDILPSPLLPPSPSHFFISFFSGSNILTTLFPHIILPYIVPYILPYIDLYILPHISPTNSHRLWSEAYFSLRMNEDLCVRHSLCSLIQGIYSSTWLSETQFCCRIQSVFFLCHLYLKHFFAGVKDKTFSHSKYLFIN